MRQTNANDLLSYGQQVQEYLLQNDADELAAGLLCSTTRRLSAAAARPVLAKFCRSRSSGAAANMRR